MVEIVNVFVYGTLKQGGVRAARWPHQPKQVSIARTRGLLYDLGPYPGLMPGEGWVEGEVWEFLPDQMPHTLAVLDKIEGHLGGEDDLYRRIVVDCLLAPGVTVQAFAYQYGLTVETRQRISADADGVCRWSLD